LRAAGVERVWRRGNGAENLDDAIFDFRGRSGALAITDDLRIFGLTQKEIFARCSALMNAGIKVIDITHPSDNIHDLQRRAFVALHAAAPIRNHRIARRRGRMGGLAKAAAAQAARDGRCSPDIVARLCRHPATDLGGLRRFGSSVRIFPHPHFNASVSGKERSDEKLERSLDNNEKSWWQRGYDDGFEGNEPAPPPNDISWSDYMHGYKAGKIKAGW
jgi:hypothetical protein